MTKIKYVKGDLLQAPEQIILHGCNARAEKHDRKHREFHLKVYDGCIETIKLAKKSC